MSSRSSISKFSDDLAEYLYGESPDEETGNSSEGPYWAGLYRDVMPDEVEDYPEAKEILEEIFKSEKAISVDIILFEEMDGSVNYNAYGIPKEAEEAWGDIQDEIYGEEEEE